MSKPRKPNPARQPRGDYEVGYEVGYGRPPKEHRFRKGAPSPNPAGRPRKERPSVEDLTARILAEPITVRIDGAARTMTAEEALIRRQLALALSGNQRATNLLLSLRPAAAGTVEPERPDGPENPGDETDAAILRRALRRLGGAEQERRPERYGTSHEEASDE